LSTPDRFSKNSHQMTRKSVHLEPSFFPCGRTDMTKPSHFSPFCERAYKLPAPHLLRFLSSQQPRQWDPVPLASLIHCILFSHLISSATLMPYSHLCLGLCSSSFLRSVISRSVHWQFLTDVSGQTIGPSSYFLTLASHPRCLKDASCINL
jgi:hypothetical protein